MKKLISIFCLIVFLTAPLFAQKKPANKKRPPATKTVNTKKTPAKKNPNQKVKNKKTPNKKPPAKNKNAAKNKKTAKSKSSMEYILRPAPIGIDVVSFNIEGFEKHTLVDYRFAVDASIIFKNGLTLIPLIRFGGASFFGMEGLCGYTYKIKPNMLLTAAGGLGFEVNAKQTINNFCLPLRVNFDYLFMPHHGINAEIGDALCWGTVGFVNHFSIQIGYSYKF